MQKTKNVNVTAPTQCPNFLIFVSKTSLFAAGTCWLAMLRNGRCTEILYEKSTKEQCCGNRLMQTAYSPDELDPGAFFFWRVLGDGVRCLPCQVSCKDVDCGVDKTCTIRKGRAKCVCSSKCKEGKVRAKRGPICGTDGRSYRNICRLRKRACRRKSHSLAIAYSGTCQTSCDKIKCPSGMHCLLDQNLHPHCVNCSKRCSDSPRRREVCGSDGVTYPSACHLREKTCRRGKAIPIAYKGPCREGATCGDVRCQDRQSCLTDPSTGMPRCVSCTSTCRPRHMHGPICGTNNSTYHSWCDMMVDSCAKGFVIDTKHPGRCGGGEG
ncbi:follistatin [Tribolium castaneum]|uniref:Follistatin n=1 Tax=Tribolium castaneum TaxID=7070 RepID=D6WTE8_TRICA|nr:follistatin [Tribolium castaneum]